MAEQANVMEHAQPGDVMHREGHTFFDSLGYPASHYEDVGQQKEAATLGMWLFLATEVLLFGGMFAGYFAYRHAYPDAWLVGSSKLYASIGSINTGVLLASSLCVALGIHAAQKGNRKQLVLFLVLTMGFGGAFLGIKAYEYYLDYKEHLVPGWDFLPDAYAKANSMGANETVGAAELEEKMELSPHNIPADLQMSGHDFQELLRQVQLFLTFYFIMTIIHAIHMIAGISVMAVLTVLAWRGRFTSKYYTPVEMAGLYWHFVDIVWVFLLPALYFVRPFPHH